MTEDEWLARAHAVHMVEFLQSKASDRKLCLLGCASVRCFWEHLKAPAARSLLELFEAYADGLTSYAELHTRWETVFEIMRSLEQTSQSAHRAALETCLDLTRTTAADLTVYWGCRSAVSDVGRVEIIALSEAGITSDSAAYGAAIRQMVVRGASCVRDIFGNPFRPVAFDAAWRTDTAVSLAQQMYESREFSAMPILADAIQDAGCENADILKHCRDANAPHVRGCWVVDLVLAKE